LLENSWTQNEIEKKLKFPNHKNPRPWILKKTKSSKKGGRERKKSKGWGVGILVKKILKSKKYMSKVQYIGCWLKIIS